MFSGCQSQGSLGCAGGSLSLGGFSGFGSFGDCGGAANPNAVRPSPTYVMIGDVIQVKLMLLAGGYDPIFGTSQASGIAALRSYNWAQSCLSLVALDDSNAGVIFTLSPFVVISLQALQDFSQINDVVNIVSSVALSLGLNVDNQNTNGIISQAVQANKGLAQTNTAPPGTAPPPGQCKTGDWMCALGLTDPLTGLASTWLVPVMLGGAALLIFSVVRK